MYKNTFLVSLLFLVACTQNLQEKTSYIKAYKEVFALKNGFAIVANDAHKYGMIDSTGKEIIACEYSFLRETHKNILTTKKDNKFGCISMKGKIVLPCEYDKIYYADCDYFVPNRNVDGFDCSSRFSNGVLIAKQAGKYIICDENGELFSAEKYDDAQISKKNNRHIIVKKNNKYGIWDTRKKEIIPCEKDTIIYTTDFLSISQKDGKWAMNDSSGREIVPHIYDNIEEIIQGLYWKVRLDDKVGIINAKGKIVKGIEYEDIDKNLDARHLHITKAKRKGKWGVETLTGKTIIPFQYDTIEIVNELENTFFFLLKRKNKTEIRTKSGDFLFETDYHSVRAFDNTGKLWIVSNDKKQGLVSNKGKMLLPCKYDEIAIASDSLILIRLHGKTGIVNRAGKIILPIFFEEINVYGAFILAESPSQKIKHIYHIKKGKLAIENWDGTNYIAENQTLEVWKNNKCGLLDKNGNLLFELKYNKIYANYDNYYVVENGLVGIYNKKGELLMPHTYDETSFYAIDAHSFAVKKYGKWGAINLKSEIIVPFRFNSMEKLNEYLYYKTQKPTKFSAYFQSDSIVALEPKALFYKGRKNNKWAILDSNFQSISPYQFESIAAQRASNYVILQQNGKYGLAVLTQNSYKMVLPCQYVHLSLHENTFAYLIDETPTSSIVHLASQTFVIKEKNLNIFYCAKEDKILVMQLGNKQGAINFNGKIILPLTGACSRIQRLSAHKIIYQQSNEWHIVEG